MRCLRISTISRRSQLRVAMRRARQMWRKASGTSRKRSGPAKCLELSSSIDILLQFCYMLKVGALRIKQRCCELNHSRYDYLGQNFCKEQGGSSHHIVLEAPLWTPENRPCRHSFPQNLSFSVPTKERGCGSAWLRTWKAEIMTCSLSCHWTELCFQSSISFCRSFSCWVLEWNPWFHCFYRLSCS